MCVVILNNYLDKEKFTKNMKNIFDAQKKIGNQEIENLEILENLEISKFSKILDFHFFFKI